jgi:hypothetical protein
MNTSRGSVKCNDRVAKSHLLHRSTRGMINSVRVFNTTGHGIGAAKDLSETSLWNLNP